MVAPAVAGAAGAKAAVGSFFNGAGAIIFVNWVLEKIGGKIPTNFDKWWNGYKKKSKVQLNTNPAKQSWKECEKILASNLHKITEHKNFFSEILNIDFGEDDYDILENQKVKLFITLSKNLRIKSNDKPDNDKKYSLFFESEQTKEGYQQLKDFNKDKVLTEKEFNNLKPLLEKEEGVWKFKHGGEKISLYLKTEKEKHSNTMDTILYTDDKKYTNFIKKLHVILKRQELNDDMFNKSKKENVLLNIDTEKIPDPSLRNLIINLLGFLIVVASVVLAVKLIVTATIGICIGIFGWCLMNYE